MIKSKQLENTLRSESNPFDTVYSDRTVGDLNGAIRFTALNNTGSTISAYKVVYINGVSGNTPTIALADADTASMPAFGITASAVTTGNEVDVITFGNIKGVDTSLLSVGDVLYVSTVAGEYTTTAPTGSSAKLQNIGMVVKADTNGIIKVGGAGRSAATPNLDSGKFFIGNASNQSSQSAYALPTSDGSANQVLATNGSGQLSFVDQTGGAGGGSAADDITLGDAAVTIATTAGDITIDAQGNDTDIIFKGTDNNVDIEMLRLDASNSGNASFSNDIKLVSDNSAIYFGADEETILSHFHNSGLRIWVNPSVAGDNDPTLWLHKTSSTSNIGPRLWLYHDKTSAANGDILGTIDFTGDDSVDGGNIYNYCNIQGIAKNVTADAWEGEIQLKVRKGDAASTSLNSALTVQANNSGGSTVDIIDHDGATEGLKLAGTLVTSTAAELNFLDTSVKSPSSGDVLSYNGTSLAWSAPSGGSSTPSVTSASPAATYSITNTTTPHQVYLLTPTANIDVTLPSAATAGSGSRYDVKNLASGFTLTLKGQTGDNIDGVAPTTGITIGTQYESLTVISDGSDWFII